MSLVVTQLTRYPVKALRGHDLTSADVEMIGLADDRRWMVVDDQGQFLTQRECPSLAQIEVDITATGLQLRHAAFGAVEIATPDAAAAVQTVRVWDSAVPAQRASAAAVAALSAYLERPAHLVYLSDPAARPISPSYAGPDEHVSFADGFPLLLATEASIADLNARLETPVEMRRFRPNLVIAGSAPWAEDGWVRIRIGAVMFRIAKPCGRCIVTTLDPMTGARTGREPLRTLAQFHRATNGDACFGQNLVPETLGVIKVGDPVEVLETGPSNLGVATEG